MLVSAQKRRQGGEGAGALPCFSSNQAANFNQIRWILVFTEEVFGVRFFGCFRERSGRPTTTTETTTAASGANNRGGCSCSLPRQVVEGLDPPPSLPWSSLAPNHLPILPLLLRQKGVQRSPDDGFSFER